jgi:AraC-like DNA-binding protein
MEVKVTNSNKNESFNIKKIDKIIGGDSFDIRQHSLYELVCISKGNIKLTIDFQTYNLKENTIYLIRPEQIHQWVKDDCENKCIGYIFHFSKDFLPTYDMVNKLYEKNSFPVIELSSDIFNNINQLILMLLDENKNNTLSAYLFASILEYTLKLRKTTTNLYYKDQRIYLLLDLIEVEFINEKSALFYANSLGLTTKRLNELTKKYLNKTVSSLIFERNIIEIKRELTYSNLTITEVSDNLGFNTTSHFSKFFKQYTSYSPLEFKKLNRIK